MGHPAEKLRRATYADVEAAPPNKVAELIAGTLYVMPRPAPKHAQASSRLGIEIGGPFDMGKGGPGGWRILGRPGIEAGEFRDRLVHRRQLAKTQLGSRPLKKGRAGDASGAELPAPAPAPAPALTTRAASRQTSCSPAAAGRCRGAACDPPA
jgi:hypothetical protein